jgi:uncharacterized repeat protein (TIGR03803 family)
MPSPSHSTRTTLSVALFVACAIFLVTFAANPAFAQTETVLHSFSGKDGQFPYSNLIFDSSGNMYGTTSAGGATGNGTVFELSPNGSGGWTETVLYSFTGSAFYPDGGLVFDSKGNLYGTTYYGGAYKHGTVYQLKPNNGRWEERTLHSFDNNGKDGTGPTCGLTFDSAGNLYGTTPTGGTANGGTVFQLVEESSGAWEERILYNFPNSGNAAVNSWPVTFDAAGNLYGAVQAESPDNYGFIYELTPQSSGAWVYKTLLTFDYSNGASPQTNLLIDSSGNVYGTAAEGGAASDGIAFKLSQATKGQWSETILTNFNALASPYIGYPLGNIAFDSAGNIYGSTFEGGSDSDGTVFELSPVGNGTWEQILLHSFAGGSDGSEPWGGVVVDSSGNVYGTTISGGVAGYGTVWEVTP